MKEIMVSEIQIVPIKPRNGLLAFISFVLNDSFYVGDIALYSRPTGGYRLSYPSKVLVNGCKVSCFHPITKGVGETIEKAVIESFENLMTKTRQGEENHDSKSY